MGTGNIVFKFNSSEGATFRPYLIGGGGVYNFKTTGTNDLGTIVSTDNSTTKFGLNAGAGFDFKLGSVGLFLESRFHDVFMSGQDLKFVPITLGLRFGGS
jgi:opacity protein-like surface antigen